jgi:predicted NUDIX family NTP pyrophosphohydrolase
MGKKSPSAGILLYKKNPYRVLLVHPSGDYNKKALWSIPKGKIEKNETLLEAAKREIFEEVGIHEKFYSTPIEIEKVVYNSGKKVYCFIANVEENINPTINWENDKAEFFELNIAKEMLMIAQKPFIERFINKINNE